MEQRTYSTRSLHGQVVHELGKRIVTGDISEGEVLPNETQLGASFDVSRTALREGIKVLTAKGLLASRTRTGTRVRPRNEWNMLDPDILAWRLESGEPEQYIQDLVEFRQAVEPLAASLAAKRASEKFIHDIQQAFDDMVEAGADVEASVAPTLRFHQGILHASGNELLAPLGALVEAALTMSFRLAEPSSKLEEIKLHADILEAIKAHDSRAAWKAMFALLDRTVEYNLAAMTKMQKGT
jgi:DNA-binding FadR family transcriptional regulator